MVITINVANQIELRRAIFQVSNDFAADGVVAHDYVINIVSPPGVSITLTHILPPVRGDGIHTITINGNGHTIDAARIGCAFFIHSGKVELRNLVIVNVSAQGDDGGCERWDGDFGDDVERLAGNAVVVRRGAVVRLSSVTTESAAVSGAVACHDAVPPSVRSTAPTFE